MGKVEGSIEAVRTALRKLEEGRSAEDSEAVCAPEVVHQIYKWNLVMLGLWFGAKDMDLAPEAQINEATSIQREVSCDEIRNKLRVYLAPFMHGMRYTSFGRHFTKVDKLKETSFIQGDPALEVGEVVPLRFSNKQSCRRSGSRDSQNDAFSIFEKIADRLHWYAKDGDTSETKGRDLYLLLAVKRPEVNGKLLDTHGFAGNGFSTLGSISW
ncbi:hypothetical protein DVH24_003263 [Malus domestica]|uniref:Uncharacterized protein n=1 Tax=Malus domestica TaxID=3750 RepID=A0A498IKT6_MALDO|nr:hypothetical protein DVH24_003263 [Malus domestica]